MKKMIWIPIEEAKHYEVCPTGMLIDGKTKEQCYADFCANMRSEGTEDTTIALTGPQKAAARGMWTAFLKIQQEQAREVDRQHAVSVVVDQDAED